MTVPCLATLYKESPMNEAGLVHLSQEKDRLAEILMMN
jgi:hypothetical protein